MCDFKLASMMINDETVLILSQEEHEQSTLDLIDWLDYLGLKFYRINGIDIYKKIRIELNKNHLKILIGDELIDIMSFSAIWIRRWYTMKNLKEMTLDFSQNHSNGMVSTLNGHLWRERFTLNEFITKCLNEHPRCINKKGLMSLNKLYVLKIATSLGIDIPYSFVFTSKKELSNIIPTGKEKSVVNKSISEALDLSYKEHFFMGYTTPVSNMSTYLDSNFAPSLVQLNVQKEYEIRSFLIGENIYSMAIFSQSNKQTSTDFRIYDDNYPNRYCPYKLPKKLEKKLIALSKSLDIQTGSFDLIKSKDKNYYFLEVNPEGQYGMTSLPCNYFLDREIALYLTK